MFAVRKLFNPDTLRVGAPSTRSEPKQAFTADYVYDDPTIVAVNVALATGRPLLLRGDPGSGKSTLARDVARLLGWRYYEKVVSSNVEADDMLWRVDHVRRIADAQASRLDAPRPAAIHDYIEPGVLWWAFDPDTARIRGARSAPAVPAADPGRHFCDPGAVTTTRAVVLIDEIDKAEPDFPNDLLVPLGALAFSVQIADVHVPVAAGASMRPLVMVTTNEERDLPPAFLRRCVVLRLELPRGERLRAIARSHFDEAELDDVVLDRLIERYEYLFGVAAEGKLRRPSTAELLDAARALVQLKQDGGGNDIAAFLEKNLLTWRQITTATLWKHPIMPPERERAS